jgi:hypothetical protein
MTIPSAKPGHLGCDLTNAFSIVIDFNFDELLMLAVQPVSNAMQNFGPVGSTVSPIGLLRRRERSLNSEVNVSFVSPGNLRPDSTRGWIDAVNPFTAVWRGRMPIYEMLKLPNHVDAPRYPIHHT